MTATHSVGNWRACCVVDASPPPWLGTSGARPASQQCVPPCSLLPLIAVKGHAPTPPIRARRTAAARRRLRAEPSIFPRKQVPQHPKCESTTLLSHAVRVGHCDCFLHGPYALAINAGGRCSVGSLRRASHRPSDCTRLASLRLIKRLRGVLLARDAFSLGNLPAT
jgi:hypothetical protein